jgi:hypothetical protein
MPELATAAPHTSVSEALDRIKALADPGRLDGMARYGIATGHAVGVSIPQLR